MLFSFITCEGMVLILLYGLIDLNFSINILKLLISKQYTEFSSLNENF